MPDEKLQQLLSEVYWAEHMGDVKRAVRHYLKQEHNLTLKETTEPQGDYGEYEILPWEEEY